MPEEKQLFKLTDAVKKGVFKIREKEMTIAEAAALNDYLVDKKSTSRWLDGNAKVWYLKHFDPAQESGIHTRRKLTVEEANEKMLALMQERPVEFVESLMRLMSQNAFNNFVAFEKYRAALNDPRVGGEVLIPTPKCPEDTPMICDMADIIDALENNKVLDECLKVEKDSDNNDG